MTIHINQKMMLVNVISNLGDEVEVDTETLARWNSVISSWWEVQFEMDKLIKDKIKEKLKCRHEWESADGFKYCINCPSRIYDGQGSDD